MELGVLFLASVMDTVAFSHHILSYYLGQERTHTHTHTFGFAYVKELTEAVTSTL